MLTQLVFYLVNRIKLKVANNNCGEKKRLNKFASLTIFNHIYGGSSTLLVYFIYFELPIKVRDQRHVI